jgi:hypothetical protein
MPAVTDLATSSVKSFVFKGGGDGGARGRLRGGPSLVASPAPLSSAAASDASASHDSTLAASTHACTSSSVKSLCPGALRRCCASR